MKLVRLPARTVSILLGVAALCLLAPVGAGAEITVFELYEELPPLVHAPLVPMYFPPAMQPIGHIRVFDEELSHGRYSELYTEYARPTHPVPRPIVLGDLQVRNLGAKSLRRVMKTVKRDFRVSPVTVRGRQGALLHGKGRGNNTIALAWSEGGNLYELATATPKAVPLSQLQATASGMDRLTGQVRGEATAPVPNTTSFGVSAKAIVGEHSALVEAGWSAQCQAPPGTDPFAEAPTGFGERIVTVSAGNAALTGATAPAEEARQGETSSWTLGLSGTLSASGGQLTETVSGTNDGWACSLPPLTFSLVPFHER